jgi:hypothetical protein
VFTACAKLLPGSPSEASLTPLPVFPDGPILSFYAYSIDTSETNWNLALPYFDKLMADVGFSHLGFYVYDYSQVVPGSDAVVRARVDLLRNKGYRFFIESNGGHMSTPGYEGIYSGIDGLTHWTNGFDLKYLDSPSLTQLPAGLETFISRNTFFDPSYTGRLWQNMMSNWSHVLTAFRPAEGDVTYHDFEIWVQPERLTYGIGAGTYNVADYAIPQTLADPASNPYLNSSMGHSPNPNLENSLTVAYENFNYHWRARANDFRATTLAYAPTLPTLFFDEELSAFASKPLCYTTAVPSGSGDAPSAALYVLPNLGTLTARLDGLPGTGSCEVKTPNWNGAFMTLSFSYDASTGTHKKWDPAITQMAGALLKERGFKGLVVWPGPSVTTPNPLNMPYADYWNYWLIHAQALHDGFVNGMKPALKEICTDGMDNDGDNLVDAADSGCPVK